MQRTITQTEADHPVTDEAGVNGTRELIALMNAADEKSLGIFTFGAMAEVLGFPLPDGVRKKELVVIGIIGGFGFTVALFIAGEAFIDPAVRGAAKMGAMLSCVAAGVAIVVARAFKIKRMP